MFGKHALQALGRALAIGVLVLAAAPVVTTSRLAHAGKRKGKGRVLRLASEQAQNSHTTLRPMGSGQLFGLRPLLRAMGFVRHKTHTSQVEKDANIYSVAAVRSSKGTTVAVLNGKEKVVGELWINGGRIHAASVSTQTLDGPYETTHYQGHSLKALFGTSGVTPGTTIDKGLSRRETRDQTLEAAVGAVLQLRDNAQLKKDW